MKKSKLTIKPWEMKVLRLVIFSIILLSVFFILIPNYSNQSSSTVTFPDKTVINVELAKNSLEKARGLSNREELALDHGMLFLFTKPEIPTFWMRDMNFSIDIIWLLDGKIVDVSPNVPIDKQLHSPQKPINQVLEVNAGLIDRHNLKINDQLEIDFIE